VALLLLHGFTQTSRSWDPVVERLRGVDVVALDLRGHGEARNARPIDFASVVGDVVAAAPVGATLCGYSMGGRVALRAALDAPSRFGRLVLVGASPGLASSVERAERRAADSALARCLNGATMEEFASRWGSQEVFATQSEAVRAFAHLDRLRNDPRALAVALRGLGTGAMEPLWDRLGELALPVTLVAGERDAKFVAIARDMAARIAGAEVVVAPGAGHAAHLEAPDAVAAVLQTKARAARYLDE
jgi:2-succinyl-6-hydroxy-2,4-cyclohexadiene-1-carboxylate synthase